MRRHTVRKLAYYGFTAGYALAVVISAIISACLKANPSDLQGNWALFSSPLRWVQDRAWIILLALAIYLLIAELVRRLVGPPWVWKAIHNLLDLFQQYAFREQPGGMLHNHRVTLFKYTK